MNEFNRKKRRIQKYLVSYPTIALAIFIAFLTMMAYYHVQYAADEKYLNADSYFDLAMRILPSIGYSLVVIPLNMVYKMVSVYLTDWGRFLCLLKFFGLHFLVVNHDVKK